MKLHIPINLRGVLVTISSIVFAVLVSSLLLAAFGANPFPIYSTIFVESFADLYGFSETLVKATPILLCALAVAVPAWVGLMNIGAEGQFYAGAIGGTCVALAFPHLGPLIIVPLMLMVAFIGGGLWGGIAGVLKGHFGVNEVMITLMSNFIAILLVDHLVHGAWKDPSSHGWPQSPEFSASAIFPTLGTSRMHLGLALGLISAALLSGFRKWTSWGLGMRVVGANPDTAAYAGLNVAQYLLWAMVIGGGLAALAGISEVSAIQGRLRSGISPGYGYTGILVSWMAGHHPVAIIIFAVFIGGLLAGGDNLQITLNLPFATVNIVIGLMFFFLLVGNYLFGNSRIRSQTHGLGL